LPIVAATISRFNESGVGIAPVCGVSAVTTALAKVVVTGATYNHSRLDRGEKWRGEEAIRKLRSDITKYGLARTPHRAFMRAMGLDDAAIAKPMVGVAAARATGAPIIPGGR